MLESEDDIEVGKLYKLMNNVVCVTRMGYKKFINATEKCVWFYYLDYTEDEGLWNIPAFVEEACKMDVG